MAAGTTPEGTPADALLGRLDRIREDAIHLLEVLGEVEAATKQPNPKTKEQDLRRTVTEAVSLRDELELARQPDELQRALDGDASVARNWSAGSRAIADDLRSAIRAWPKDPKDPVLTSRLEETQRLLRAVAMRAAELVVPMRLNDRLAHYRVGKPLRFDQEFDHDLPDAADRQKLLQRLTAQAGRISGIIDADAGLVYKISPSKTYRVLTYLSPLIFTVAGGLFLWLIASLDDWGIGIDDTWGLNNLGQLMTAYLLVLAGTVVHLLVESAKQQQVGTVAILPITDGLDWLHLRWAGLGLTFVWLVAVVIALRVLGVETNGDDLALYVAAGYSLDSVAGLFLTRFSASAGAGLKTLTGRLSGPG